MVIKCEQSLSNSQLQQIAEASDPHSGRKRVLLRQKRQDDVVMYYIELCTDGQEAERMAYLQTQGYSSGPQPSGPFYIQEGQVISVESKGNVQFMKIKSTELIYSTYSPRSCKEGLLKVMDTTEQQTSKCYIWDAGILSFG